MKVFFSSVCCCILFGCTSINSLPPTPTISRDDTIHIDPRLLEECPPMKPLQSSTYDQGESLEAIKIWADDYSNCKSKHHALILLIKQAFNLDIINQ
jgi:hypothetical protein